MPRVYKRKTARERKTPEEIQQAVQLVLQNEISARQVAAELGFSKSSLQRHVQNAKKTTSAGPTQLYIYSKSVLQTRIFHRTRIDAF